MDGWTASLLSVLVLPPFLSNLPSLWSLPLFLSFSHPVRPSVSSSLVFVVSRAAGSCVRGSQRARKPGVESWGFVTVACHAMSGWVRSELLEEISVCAARQCQYRVTPSPRKKEERELTHHAPSGHTAPSPPGTGQTGWRRRRRRGRAVNTARQCPSAPAGPTSPRRTRGGS